MEAVAALREAGVVGGYPDGSFRPQRAATRAEACVMLLHALPV
ncbi:MAG: S-layer homology domain-containing protein [Clostridiales bacterium]|nr:S-layer homology domain-containing protein [Clostridiales bacterium]